MCVLLEGGEGSTDEDRPAGANQIYDIPYDAGTESDGGSTKTPVTRPELDPRPSVEYELPWEWKKEQIVRALSGSSGDSLSRHYS